MTSMEWDLGVATYTLRTEDGFYEVQLDLYGAEETGAPAMEAYHPCGFIGRPRDPDVDPDGTPTLGATVLYGFEGNQGHALHLNDPRVAPLLPEVKKGGAMVYAHRADGKVSFELFDGDDGTWQVYVPSGSTASTIAIDARDPEMVSIQLQHGKGHGITLDGDGVVQLRNRTNTVSISLTDDEAIINSGTLRIQAGVVMGGDAAAPLAKAAELLAWVTAVQAACAPAGITIPPLPPSVATVNTKGA